jgi:serine/threonine protein kinase
MMNKTMDPMGAMLIREGLAEPGQIERAIQIQQQKGGLLGEILIGLGVLSEESLQQILAKRFQLPFFTETELFEREVHPKLLQAVGKELAYRYLLLPLEMTPSRELMLAVQSTLPEDLCRQIMEKTGSTILRYVLATREDLSRAIHFHYSKELHKSYIDLQASPQNDANPDQSAELMTLMREGICHECGHPRNYGDSRCYNCGTSFENSTQDPFVGRVIGGKWKIMTQLGMGGMGMVFRGIHLKSKKPIAIKLLRSQFSERQEARNRFFQEAQILRQLKHPNITQLYEFGYAEGLSFYLVMELMVGRSCDEIKDKRTNRFPTAFIPMFVEKVCDAMYFAHQKGVIHRDLKPDNIFLIGEGRTIEDVKVLDFGIAKIREREQLSYTQTGATLGTPQYISPEQAMGKELDERSDIYSFAVVLFELLTGESVFEADTAFEYMMRHVYTEPPLLSETLPELNASSQLDDLFVSALAKDKEDRPASMADFKKRFLHAWNSTLNQPTQRRMSSVTQKSPSSWRYYIGPSSDQLKAVNIDSDDSKPQLTPPPPPRSAVPPRKEETPTKVVRPPSSRNSVSEPPLQREATTQHKPPSSQQSKLQSGSRSVSLPSGAYSADLNRDRTMTSGRVHVRAIKQEVINAEKRKTRLIWILVLTVLFAGGTGFYMYGMPVAKEWMGKIESLLNKVPTTKIKKKKRRRVRKKYKKRKKKYKKRKKKPRSRRYRKRKRKRKR